MTRARVNPHARGTPEHLLHNRWRLASQKAATLRREAETLFTEAGAEQAKADHYAKALEALGHPVTQRLLEGPKS
ncbi:MAG: hypothetical protein B7Y36_18630 [Novosphingobium sp. 28-62-57]|uniref:hypothetical protein n=1 Tax=unclassified Novosphingobium TaxID=2644732 RepID=UPI000BDD1647|nr:MULTISPECIES: hypothetical protein [unclassified Novosphingobium]OYW50756.1 MAG: hypothetical protein B7Z34_02730 [Novosphingobium sp. 12-62-10]OYZ07885.1 MAG: hypothetical protein B7Y36_18630 [Novosphingobium sp. 28-62-57]